MTSYIFDNTAERETEQRFSSLESLYDPLTTRHLVATGIGPGWRCWERRLGEMLARQMATVGRIEAQGESGRSKREGCAVR
jgi:hypothetical protein